MLPTKASIPIQMLSESSPKNGVGKLTSALVSAILALCLFPDVQSTAQDEVDTVVGNSRSPSWGDFDEERLPYVCALAKEILRWRTIIPLSCAPPSVQDATFRDFFLPRKSQFVCNIYAIHRNSREFPHTHVVRPERFLGNKEDGLEFYYPDDTGHNAFGWGLQWCSGQALAEQSLLSVLARLLWAFKIESSLDNEVSTRDQLFTSKNRKFL